VKGIWSTPFGARDLAVESRIVTSVSKVMTSDDVTIPAERLWVQTSFPHLNSVLISDFLSLISDLNSGRTWGTRHLTL
jgi:hypothetical protein